MYCTGMRSFEAVVRTSLSYMEQVSYGSMRTPRLGFGVGMNSNSDISQRRNVCVVFRKQEA